jgi:hypothetical protein
MSDELQPYRVQFTETWVQRLIANHTNPSTTEPRYLIDDGRKRQRLWNELIAEGYIQVLDEKGVITSKAFDEYASIKPDLEGKIPRPENARRDQHFWETRPGVQFDQLATAERKYVVTHPAEYKFFSFNSAWAHQGTQPLTFGENMYQTGGRSNQNIWISDEAFTKMRDAAIYELHFYDLKRKNLAWALEELSIIEAVDKDCFKVRSDHGFFHGGPSTDFGNAPDAWEKDLATSVETAREQIASMTRKANVLLKTQEKILAMGGWAKFHEAFDRLLHEYLQKKGKAE